MSEQETAQLVCLQHSDECEGPVEQRWTPDRDDFKTFPRCEFHFQQRLDQSEVNRTYMSDVEPSWFDPTYAGEHWGDDY